MTIIENFKNYLFSQAQKPSQVTVKNYLADIRKFISWFENIFSQAFNPLLVTQDVLKDYKEFLLQSFSPSSVERQFSALRKFFQFMQANEFINSNPFEEIAI